MNGTVLLRRARRHAPRALLYALVALLFVWPLAMLAAGAFRTAPPGVAGHWTLDAWAATFGSPRTLRAVGNSLVLATVVTALAVTLAALFAFLSQRTDLPGRRFVTPAMLVMFAIPSLFYVMGYSLLANAYTGLLNKAAQALFGARGPVVDIESWPGLVLVMVFRATAFLYLFLLGPMRGLNAEHEEASLVSGVGPLGTFLKVSLPQLGPALAGAALLGFIGGLEAFDSVLVIGQPAGIEVIAVRIYDYLNGSTPPDYARASMLALHLVVVVALLTWAQFRASGRRGFVTVGGKHRAPRAVALGRRRGPLAGLLVAYGIVAQVLPIGALLFSSFQPFPGVYGSYTLAHYAHVFSRAEVATAIGNTLALASGVGVATMALGLVVAYAGRQIGGLAAGLLRFATLIPVAMPGLVTALAVTWAYVSVPGLRALYGTVWLMMIALVVALSPLAVQLGQALVAQIGQELVEAARIAGRSATRTFFDVVLRLSLPGFVAGWYMTAVAVSGSLDIPLLLGGPGLGTVATRIFNLNQMGRFGEASALLVSLVAFLALLGAAVLLLRRLLAHRAPRRDPSAPFLKEQPA